MARFLVKAANGRGYYQCNEPEVVLSTREPDEVQGILNQVEELQAAGYTIAGYLSYEAARVFDRRFQTHTPTEFPLVLMLADKSVELADLPDPGEEFDQNQLTYNSRISESQYQSNYEELLELIHAGDIYQANYSFRVDINKMQTGFELFCRLELNHPTPYAAYLEFEDWQLVSSSPELFLRREGSVISTEPMKGTSPRGLWFEQDEDNREFLKKDKKNRAENLMIVDLMRNDLSKVCRPNSVHVPELFESKRFPSLHQMVSRVEGELKQEATLFDVLKATFPAGSITGAPKVRSMEVIRELETDARNIYTGSAGVFFPNGDYHLNVAIRTALLNKHLGLAELGIGSGIVSHSNSSAEWQECLLKGEFLNYKTRHNEVFETLLWDVNYLWLEEHLVRLEQSCKYFMMPLDLELVRQRLESAALQFTRGPERVRLAVDRRGEVSIKSTPLNIVGWPNETIKVDISDRFVDELDCYQYHKTDVRTHYDKALAEGLEQGFHEVLFLNSNGYLAEGAITNIMVQVDGGWKTPALACGLLEGIWRQKTITELACSVRSVSSQVAQRVDGLPDPTLPLTKQNLSHTETYQPIKSEVPASQVVLKRQDTNEKFIVLGLGRIEADKALLLAVNDSDFAYLPTPNRLSLGVFGSEKNALRRQRQLFELGLQSEVRPFRTPNELAVVELRSESLLEQDAKSTSKIEETVEPQAPRQTASEYVQLAIAFDDPTVGAFVRAVRDSQAKQTHDAQSIVQDNKSDEVPIKENSAGKSQLKKKVSGYIVASSVASLGDSEKVLEKLSKMGETDYVILRSGPYKNRVSVGVFSSLDNAFSRQDYFLNHGLKLEVIARAEERVVSRQMPVDPQVVPPKPDQYDQLALIPLDI